MRALVLDPGNSRSALAGVRALGRAGLDVGVASPVRGMAARSRWCSLLVDSADAEGFDVVVPAGDAEAFDVSLRRDSMPSRVPYATHDVVMMAFDKTALAVVARSCGVAVPELTDGPPAVVKGRSHVAGRHEAVVARTAAEFDAAVAVLDEPVVQEFVDGELVALSVVADSSSRVIARVQQRAVAVWPSPAGVSTRAETVAVDPALSASVDALVGALGWIGLAQFQFIVGRHDGVPRLIDCNGRLYGSLSLAVAAGVNLAALWLGIDGPTEAQVGVRYQWLEGDLRRAPGLGALRYAVGAQHSISSLRDPVPALVHAGDLARRVLRKARR